MAEDNEDVRRREKAATVRGWSVEDFHERLVEEGIHRAFLVYENGEFQLSHRRFLEPLRAFFELSSDFANHEGVFIGREDGLKTVFFAFVHDTRRGLAQGGLRFKSYPNLAELLVDGLRLGQGMTRKNALAGLWWGGGKGIMPLLYGFNPPRNAPERRAYFEGYGRFVASLGGVYYTAEDINTYTEDMNTILSQNRFTTCISRGVGGSGNPSPHTARGVFRAMQAAWAFLTGKDSLRGVRVAVQGAGNVGAPLIDQLVVAGAQIFVCDAKADAVEALKARYPAVTIVPPDEIFDADVDVFAPCAIGAQVNSQTIPRLRARLVCGAANNILKERADARRLLKRGIAFVPDYVCNRMGITNCADEWQGYLEADVALAAERVYPDSLRVLKHAKNLVITSLEAADELADIAASELHPLVGHRGRRLIDHLVESRWHEDGAPPRRGQPRPATRVFVPSLDEPPIRLRWEREGRFHGADGASVVASAPVAAPASPTLASVLSPLLMDVRARFLELATNRRPRRVVGSDHGGLALQLAVERSLPYEREQVGRDEFVELCGDVYHKNDASIRQQLHELGIGFDPRAWFDPMGDAGRRASERLYYALLDAGMVTRESRMTHRCPRCATVLVASDVVKTQIDAPNRYAVRFQTRSGESLEATTYLPELVIGAVALLVRPNGPFGSMAGLIARNPVTGGALPILAAPELPTTAEFLVPAHNPRDERLARAFGLEGRPAVYDERGGVLALGDAPRSLEEGRREVLARLGDGVREEPGPWRVDVERCRRCETIAIRESSSQLFVQLEPAQRGLLRALETGAFQLTSESWRERVRTRLEKMELWCISRQEWWGQEIPVRQVSSAMNGAEPEVFSTWYSSVAGTLCGMGWPEDPVPDPIDEVFVDPEVLARWVLPSQLVAMALFGRPAFRRVHVHGTVAVFERRLLERVDEGGEAIPATAPDETRFLFRAAKKPMRRSLGNAVEPRTLVQRTGADSLRLFYLLCLKPTQPDVVGLAEGVRRRARSAVERLSSKAAGLLQLLRREAGSGPPQPADDWIVAVALAAKDEAQTALSQYRFSDAAEAFVDAVSAFARYTRFVASRYRRGDAKGSPAAAAMTALALFSDAFSPICPFVFEKVQSAFADVLPATRKLEERRWKADALAAFALLAEEPETFPEDPKESGAFRADYASTKRPFTISMPPPNATGTLHLGHAVMLAVEDLMIRWHRMKGDEALWVPGTDHAAIATESVVIKQLQKQGMADPRSTLGRDELVRRIAQFVEESRSTIRGQIRATGASCDWSRERYTMDPQLSRCVNAVFARMFRQGLIYRGNRIVNWDVVLRTTVSDDETYRETRAAKLYTLRYGPFLVATSRPETKLGDTAVAVHPKDPRWQEHIGKTYDVPWPKGPVIRIKVVPDEAVDPEFGTGALGVTPAHSQIDYEIAQRHNLPLLQVIGEDGRMTEAAGSYAGLSVVECREAFAKELQAAGLLEKVESYQQDVAICYRSNQPIEALPKEQWFIDVNKPAVKWKGKSTSLKHVLRDVVESGDIRILPDHERDKYYQWIDNLRDWCISRQIWWGHRVPVWTRGEEDIHVGQSAPAGEAWVQDPDTLDTWFSSALWTWSTLIDPEKAADLSLPLATVLEQSPDFRKFHPTTVMETGYDILFFWVARMILMTTYAVSRIPFETVYLHGLVLDKDGDKMSKSKPETSIDPLDVIAESGADTLRLSLVVGSTAGHDLRISKERVAGCGRLVNKIWNAAKLVERSRGEGAASTLGPPTPEHPVNRWMLARQSDLIATANRHMEAFAFGEAIEVIRASFWGEFCDFYLEAIKGDSLGREGETRSTLLFAFDQYLRLFHPFAPFVTEEVWGLLGFQGALIKAEWPKAQPTADWVIDAATVEMTLRLLNEIRRLRQEAFVEPGAKAKVHVALRNPQMAKSFDQCRDVLERLGRIEGLEIVKPEAPVFEDTKASVAADPEFTVAVIASAENREKEKAQLQKKLEKARQQMASLDKRLGDEKFLTNASAEVVQTTRTEREGLAAVEEALVKRLERLGG